MKTRGIRLLNTRGFRHNQRVNTRLQSTSTLKIAVFAHVYDLGVWDQIQSYLENIAGPFDLHINLVRDGKTDDQLQTFFKRLDGLSSRVRYKIYDGINRGRDIGGFINIINNVDLAPYDIVLFVHTKTSRHMSNGYVWRKDLLDGVLHPQYINKVLESFSDNSVGIVGNNSYFQTDLGLNALPFNKLCDRLRIRNRTVEYIAGTFFWIRSNILQVIKDAHFKYEDFEIGEPLNRQYPDGQLAHAFERIFCVLSREAGYKRAGFDSFMNRKFIPSIKPRKILWVIPGVNISGGNRVIFEIANRMSTMPEFDVNIASLAPNKFDNWMDVNFNIIPFVDEQLAFDSLKDEMFDFVFATGWQTVNLVARLQAKKKFYFIQDYEPYFYNADKEIAEEGYKKINNRLIISNWIGDILKEEGLNSNLIKLGTNQYGNQIRVVTGDKKQVLIYLKDIRQTARGADLLLKVVDKIRHHPKIKVVTFGDFDPHLSNVIFKGKLLRNDLVNLYKESHIFVDASRHRGICTVAMEAAQFGVVPVMTLPEFGLLEYGFLNNVNSIFTRLDIDEIVDKVTELAVDDKKYKELRKNIITLGKTFQWSETVNSLIHSMNKSDDPPPISVDVNKIKKIAEEWNDDVYFKKAEFDTIEVWMKIIIPFLCDCKIDYANVLDLGAGYGRNSEILKKLAGTLHVVDINEKQINYCKNRLGNNNIFYYVNNGYDLHAVESNSISFVFSFDTMVHFPFDAVRSYLSDISRVLVKNGLFFCHHSNICEKVTNVVEEKFDIRSNIHLRNYMSMDMFRELANQCGLTVIKQQRLDWAGDKNLDGLSLCTI